MSKWARIEHHPDGLHFYSSYDSDLVSALKSKIPFNDRSPHYENNKFRYWIISPKKFGELRRIIKLELGIDAQIIGKTIQGSPQQETRLIRVEYIGQVKDRAGGEPSAFGAVCTQGWGIEFSIVLPESVLKNWFNGDDKIISRSTFYTALAVVQSATKQELKKAYRKQSRRYHPDVNKDEDAHEMMLIINNAYDILRNPLKRKRYDAGLKLEASLDKKSTIDSSLYGSLLIPVRCGMILAKGQYKVGRFTITEILQWDDIVENGKTLVTSWDSSTNLLVRNWV